MFQPTSVASFPGCLQFSKGPLDQSSMEMSGVGKELFLSYGREPEVVSFVTQLKHDLEKSGFTVWLDTEVAICVFHVSLSYTPQVSDEWDTVFDATITDTSLVCRPPLHFCSGVEPGMML